MLWYFLKVRCINIHIPLWIYKINHWVYKQKDVLLATCWHNGPKWLSGLFSLLFSIIFLFDHLSLGTQGRHGYRLGLRCIYVDPINTALPTKDGDISVDHVTFVFTVCLQADTFPASGSNLRYRWWVPFRVMVNGIVPWAQWPHLQIRYRYF